MYSILFILITVMQAVSLNRGVLDDKQHPLVTKSRIVGLHVASHCGLLSLVPQRSRTQECCVPTRKSLSETPKPTLLSHGQPKVQRKRKSGAFSVSYSKSCHNEGAVLPCL